MVQCFAALRITEASTQRHPLIQIWSLLVPRKQDGDGQKARLEASKQQSTNQWVTSWYVHLYYTVYGPTAYNGLNLAGAFHPGKVFPLVVGQ